MGGEVRTAAELSFSDFRLEQLVQDGSGPFDRAHRLDRPSLVYLPPPDGGRALGCFGEPRSHLSYRTFGTAIVVPAHVPLHVRSPAFRRREMLIVQFDEARFAALTGVSAASHSEELAGCADIRTASVLDVLARLSRELARPATARETMVAGLGLVALGELARHFEAMRHRARGRGMLAEWQLRRIEDRLADAARPLPDVDELALACGVGRRHLMRAYKASTGTTVMHRVERTLFERARRLLEADRLPIKAIAGALGYESHGSFSTAFRHRFGQTPSEWRTQRRAEAAGEQRR